MAAPIHPHAPDAPGSDPAQYRYREQSEAALADESDCRPTDADGVGYRGPRRGRRPGAGYYGRDDDPVRRGRASASSSGRINRRTARGTQATATAMTWPV